MEKSSILKTMNVILLQSALFSQEVSLLIQEFPQYLFLSLSEASYKNLSGDYWDRLEILYGSRLTSEELVKAHHLRWIHSPISSLSRFCLEEIEKQGNVLVTQTIEDNFLQVGEFVMGVILAFAKNLFQWKDLTEAPGQIWDSKHRDTLWSLKNKVILQVGLNAAGSEIAKKAKQHQMRVWGMDEKRSFHPHCDKTFDFRQVRDLLPHLDILSLSLPKRKEYHHWLQFEELELIKKGTILVVLGTADVIKEEALVQVAQSGKFRGILIDASYQHPIPAQSPLWKIPNVLITPEIAQRPKSLERQAFRLFLYNLRQYLHGNYQDMKNLYSFTNS